MCKKSEKHKNSAKFEKYQKWPPVLSPSIWGYSDWYVGHMGELFALLASQSPCK